MNEVHAPAVLRTDRSKVVIPGAIRAGVVAAVATWCAVRSGNPAHAIPLAIGILFVAITESGEGIGRRWRTMLWVTLWLMGSCLLAGLLSHNFWLGLIASTLVSAVLGFSGAGGPRAGLGGLLTLIIFIVTLGAPDSPLGSLQNALLVGLGGVIITSFVVFPVLLRHPRKLLHAEKPLPMLAAYRSHVHWNDPLVRHSARLAIAVTTATAIPYVLNFEHSYWIPMTVAWVLKPSKSGTTQRIEQRIAGTLAGLLSVALFVEVIHMNGLWLSLIVGVATFVAVAYIWANYSYAVAGITALVVALFTLVGDPVGETLVVRILCTLGAGVLAYLVSLLWPLPD